MGTPQFGEHRAFWDRAAQSDVLVAILDTDGTRDPQRAMAEFRAWGEEHARALLGYVHGDAVVVDLGCGIGRILAPLARHCRRAVGVDVSDEMIEQGQNYVGDLAPNLAFVKTDGRTLPGMDDASVDFLYSMLVLIHVDRRSAFHYFCEIRRVLRAQGIARLQFHDIMSDEGLAKFREIASTDYPLEFYTETELRRLLGAAGLVPVQVEATGFYLMVDVVVAASADAWYGDLARDLQVDEHEVDGAFADASTFDPAQPGRCAVRLAAPARALNVELVAAVGPADAAMAGATTRSTAFAKLRPGVATSLEFTWDPRSATFGLQVDGEEAVALQVEGRGMPDADEAELMLGVLPPAHSWTAETLRRFPSLFDSRRFRPSGR